MMAGVYALRPSPLPRKINPRKGGWSKKKIAEYNRQTGSKLKHGVDYDPQTLEDLKRKGSWATRHYKRKNSASGLNQAPLKTPKGELTPFATQALVWGEEAPENRGDQRRLVKLGEELLEAARELQAQGYDLKDELPGELKRRFKKGLK